MGERDVLIVGAGPAGSALAYLLATQGVDVLLLDKAEFPRDKTCGDGLSPRALGVLRTMGLLDQATAVGCKINGIHIYAPNGQRVSSPIPPQGHLPQYVLVIPRFRFDDLVRAHAVAAGAEFRPRVDVTDVLRDGEQIVGVRAATPNGPGEFQARYVVLATGAAVALLERARLLAAPPLYGRAARAYYEGVGELDDYIEFHLASVPLPGYGWVFPVSPSAANVGAGYLVSGRRTPAPGSPRHVFDEFVAHPLMASRLKRAQMTGPVKGYPLRFDFPSARLAFPGLVLVGEAAGMVNPMTGEGIDYALESAEVAAEALVHALRDGASPADTETAYQRAMRARFQRTFVSITRMRDVYFRPWLLDRVARAAKRHEAFRLTLIQICLGNVDPGLGFSPRMLWSIALG